MESNRNNKPSSGVFSPGFFVGAALVLIGILMFFNHLGMIMFQLHHVLFSWPMILIAIGLYKIFSHKHSSSGIVLVAIGGMFMLPRIFDNFHSGYYLPIILIAVGLIILLRKLSIIDNFHKSNCPRHTLKEANSSASPSGSYHERNAVFAGVELVVLDKVFYGGRFNNIFGGTKLDLRRTSLEPGDTIIVVNAIFGGIEIFVPEDWNVVVQVDSLFGGFTSNRLVASPINTENSLIIRGMCLFGGGELKG